MPLDLNFYVAHPPPSGVRVVSALAMFSASISARVRCAVMPDELTCKEENRLTMKYLLGWPAVPS